MRVPRDPVFEASVEGLPAEHATRVKSIRDGTLVPGGPPHVRLFERVDGGRPHPRLHIEVPAAVEPLPTRVWIGPPEETPKAPAGFDARAHAELERLGATLSGSDLDPGLAPAGSERYWQHSIRVLRTAAFFEELRALVARWRRRAADANRAAAVIRVLEDEAHATAIVFDDADTGTHHSFGGDGPFVHDLEAMSRTLPADGSEAMAVLSAASAVRCGAKESKHRLTSEVAGHGHPVL